MTTLPPDLLAHLAAVRDGACDDNDLLVLADRLHDAGEYDREELVRVQVEIGTFGYYSTASKSYLAAEEKRRQSVRDRERDLLARNPAWLSVECSECLGDGLGLVYYADAPFREPCEMCRGLGDLLKGRAALTRGFVDVTLPAELCWHSGEGPSGGLLYEPHPVLRAVLASPVGPWVRRVRVEGREPAQSWWWYRDGGGSYHFNCLPGRWTIIGQNVEHFDTALDAATDALSLAVPRWARGAK